MSKYHFVATNKSKLNLIKFGINKRNIFCIGAPGLEGIKKEIKSYKYLENKYKFKFWKKNILVSIHPETLSKNSLNNLQVLLESLNNISDIKYILTSPGADPEGLKMQNKIKKFIKGKKNFIFFNSLGHSDYISFLNICDLMVGNSSSGIIEAPSLKKISIDLGNRQLGRERAFSVKSEKFHKQKIINSINLNLKKKLKKNLVNPYFISNHPSDLFLKILKNVYNK